jgi:hypothetical protein
MLKSLKIYYHQGNLQLYIQINHMVLNTIPMCLDRIVDLLFTK